MGSKSASSDHSGSWNGDAHDVDIINLFPPIADRVMDGVISEPLRCEEDLSAAEEGGTEALAADLHAWVTPQVFDFIVGATPAADTAEAEGNSNIAPALVEPDTFAAPQSLAHD